MKRTFVDKVVGFFSPEAELKRIRSRGKAEFLMRSYDAAQTFNTDDWSSASSGSANSETRGAQEVLREKGREAIRNNPYAVKAQTVIVANTVGSGILPNIKGKNKLQTKRLNEAWKEWGETTLCDANGKHDFYGLQAQVMKSIVADGEILSHKELNTNATQIRLLESDFIASHRESSGTTGETVVQGVKVDSSGTVKSYFLFESHPGETGMNANEREVSVEHVDHVFRQDRPGQLRGVSWFHPVLRPLADFNEFQQATLISRKISACYAAFITTNPQDSTLSNSDLVTKRQTESMLTPGSVRYLNDGESITLATPPKVDGYEEYCRQHLRMVAAGMGISYESMGDYSQVNFSSGKMGNNEFKRNVEMWRWGMLIPQFCDPSFKHFLKWCALRKGIPIDGATVEWVPPAWTMIDPTKEIPAIADAIRNGLTSYKKAVREQGYDPVELMNEIAETNTLLDDLKISLDSDPRKLTKAGIVQVDPSQSAQPKKSDDETSSGDKLDVDEKNN